MPGLLRGNDNIKTYCALMLSYLVEHLECELVAKENLTKRCKKIGEHTFQFSIKYKDWFRLMKLPFYVVFIRTVSDA